MITEHIAEAPDRSVALRELKPGDVFRYAHVSFEDALREELFFMVVDPWQKGTDKVCVVAVDGKLCLMRDGDHRVVKHLIELRITR